MSFLILAFPFRTLFPNPTSMIRVGDESAMNSSRGVRLFRDFSRQERTLHFSVQEVVRAQTLSVLEGLDPDRKRILLRFLYESGLIYKDKLVVSLAAANLSDANLSDANLSGADLSGANMQGATMPDGQKYED